MNEPRLELKGRRYTEDGDERIPNEGERWPE
jgi:hypothetical protein